MKKKQRQEPRASQAVARQLGAGKAGRWVVGIILALAAVALISVWASKRFSLSTRSGAAAVSAGTSNAPPETPTSTNLSALERQRQKEGTAAELNTAGNSLLKAGDLVGAVRAYKQAIAQTPDDEDLHFNLGIAYVRMGDLTNAEHEYNEALRLLPDYPEVHNNLGSLLMRRGRYAEAEAHLSEAIKQMPEYAQAHNNYGILRQRMGLTNEALESFQNAVEADTNSFEAHFNLATTYLQRNERDKAVEQLREALRINPTSDIAQRALNKVAAQGTNQGAAEK